MAREEREIHNLGEDGLPEEEAGPAGAGAEEREDLDHHLGYHNFYGY
jgi:hypothetical protein